MSKDILIQESPQHRIRSLYQPLILLEQRASEVERRVALSDVPAHNAATVYPIHKPAHKPHRARHFPLHVLHNTRHVTCHLSPPVTDESDASIRLPSVLEHALAASLAVELTSQL